MNPSDAIEAIEKPLSSLPYSLSRHILEHLRKLTSHEPVIGIMGKSGAGKSSLCNMGRIVVDIDGVNLAELINMVCDNGYSLRVVDESDRTSADCTPPFAALTGIRCSTAHITAKDNAWLYSLSHQTSDVGESEWIHFTGSGYLLRTDAWSYPVLRLKRLGLSKTFRRLVVTLTRRYGVSLIHLDASAECLPGLPTFNW